MVRDSRSSSMSSDSSSLASSRPLAQSAAALGYVLSNMLGGVPPPPPPLPGAGDADEELFNRVVALYDYSGADQHELSFAQGDVITVLEENASGWWLGLILERKGYFPSNYCEPIAKKARTLFDIANEVPVTDVRAFRAAYKYVAMEPGEVSFSPGDDVTVEQKNGDWWVGTVNGVTGRFPAIMVEPAPVSVGAPGESLDALLDELGDLTQSIVAADLSDNIAAAASSSTTATNTRRQRLSIGQMPDYLVAPAPPRLVRSLSLDLVRRPTAAAALPSGAIAVPPPMPVGIIRPRRIITESEAQKHATSRVVQQHGDGLPLSEPVERPTAALPAPPPMAAPGEVVVPLDAETQRKYDQDAAVRLWFCQQALPPSGVGAFSGFVDVGVHDARVEHCLVSTNWLLLFLAARKCNYMSSCAVPRGANGNSIACPHGQLVVHSLMELALSKARRPAVVPSIAPTYDKTITSISSDTFFGSGNNNTSSSSSSSSIKRNKAPEDVGSRAASSSATTTKSATEQSGIDLVAVRERTRVMPKPCADLLGLHWSALTRVPLLRAEVRADGEIDDASLLASLRPCVECQQSGERRLADRDAYDRLFSASATSYAIVEGGWYQAWFKYIMDELGVEPAPPHGILNRSLFQVNTTRPRTNLVQARDYAPITRELWHYIASHYDADCMIATKYSSIYSSGLTVEAIEPKR
jgi:hypothetical protein